MHVTTDEDMVFMTARTQNEESSADLGIALACIEGDGLATRSVLGTAAGLMVITGYSPPMTCRICFTAFWTSR